MKLLFDFLPVLLFFVAYKVADIYVATGVAIGVALLQSAIYFARHRKLERMQLVVVALLLALGGLTLLFKDPTFIKWKPTLVSWAFAAALIGSEFIGKKNLPQRLLSEQLTLPAPVWRRLNFAWVGFFTAVGALNLYVAYTVDENTWVNFKLFGVLGLTAAFAVLQAVYLSRHLPDPEADHTKE